MALTVNAKTFNYDSQRTVDVQRYTGPANSGTIKDIVDLKRTAPKPTLTSAGKSRSSIKLTRTLTDGTDPLDDVILELTISYPVGADSIELAAAISDLTVYAATTSASDVLVDRDISQ